MIIQLRLAELKSVFTGLLAERIYSALAIINLPLILAA